MRMLTIIIGTMFLMACGGLNKSNPNRHVYWVNSTKVPCVGAGPMQCLQVQKGEIPDPAAWQSFFSPINGFEYQPGYIYKIVVEEKQLDPAEVPADGSSIAYTLVRILDKQQDMRLRINDIWVAENIQGEAVVLDPDVDPLRLPRLEVKVGEMKYSGNDGCNNLMGNVIELGEKRIRLGVAAGTRMMCPDMKISELFNQTLPEVTSWEIKENKLYLFDAQGNALMQLRKTD
ncbi:MAG: DUF4377 domain-containing protein [Bacteroidota bacterium]